MDTIVSLNLYTLKSGEWSLIIYTEFLKGKVWLLNPTVLLPNFIKAINCSGMEVQFWVLASPWTWIIFPVLSVHFVPVFRHCFKLKPLWAAFKRKVSKRPELKLLKAIQSHIETGTQELKSLGLGCFLGKAAESHTAILAIKSCARSPPQNNTVPPWNFSVCPSSLFETTLCSLPSSSAKLGLVCGGPCFS